MLGIILHQILSFVIYTKRRKRHTFCLYESLVSGRIFLLLINRLKNLTFSMSCSCSLSHKFQHSFTFFFMIQSPLFFFFCLSMVKTYLSLSFNYLSHACHNLWNCYCKCFYFFFLHVPSQVLSFKETTCKNGIDT